jgi:hypothetical protein
MDAESARALLHRQQMLARARFRATTALVTLRGSEARRLNMLTGFRPLYDPTNYIVGVDDVDPIDALDPIDQ